MERDIANDDTVQIRKVHVGAQPVGVVQIHERHCEAVPADTETSSQSFPGWHEAAHWLRLLVTCAEEAEDWLTEHGCNPG